MRAVSLLPWTAIATASLASAGSGCTDGCAVLSALLPDLVIYQDDTAGYALSNSYWSSRQSELTPSCFFTPRSSEDVSIALESLTSRRARFTVKAGGHTAFSGGSSIDKGVTIDLLHLNQVEVSSGNASTVSVGPGARWANVSATLDPLSLAVVGGRVSDVGVAGLLLGGGISFFSGRRGWACDNIRSLEIVIASGEILTVSPTENEDLYWALRGGGGSNFGIVTKFELEAFPQGNLWSATTIFDGDTFRNDAPPIMSDLIQMGLDEDIDGHAFFVYTNLPALGGFVGLTSAYHAKPSASDPEQVPAIFEPLQELPSVLNTVTVANISTHISAIKEPYGGRATWWDTSIRADAPISLYEDLMSIFEDFVTTVGGQGTFTPFLVFQAVTDTTITQMQRNGGNALGIAPEDGALWIIQISARWTDASLDEVIETEAAKAIDKIEETAAKADALRGFKYMNYAGELQNVHASYGSASEERLQQVAERYDPGRVLSELWTGYFQV